MRTGKWTALGAVVETATAASLVFGEDPTPCYEAYLTAGPAQEQMGFEGFRDRHGDDVCANSGQDDARGAQEDQGFGRKDLS